MEKQRRSSFVISLCQISSAESNEAPALQSYGYERSSNEKEERIKHGEDGCDNISFTSLLLKTFWTWMTTMCFFTPKSNVSPLSNQGSSWEREHFTQFTFVCQILIFRRGNVWSKHGQLEECSMLSWSRLFGTQMQALWRKCEGIVLPIVMQESARMPINVIFSHPQVRIVPRYYQTCEIRTQDVRHQESLCTNWFQLFMKCLKLTKARHKYDMISKQPCSQSIFYHQFWKRVQAPFFDGAANAHVVL